MKKLILILLTITLISGCAGMPDIFQGLFGTPSTTVKELPPDILVIQNLNVIPNPPINTGDQFTVSFEIKNQEETKEVENVVVQLFDYGLCGTGVNYLTPPTWTESGGVFSYLFSSFAPQQTEFVEWTFTAPKSEQTGHLRITCPIRFKVSYNFTSISQTDVDVISYSRLQQLQRAGEVPTFTPTVSVGRGPVKIYFDFGAALPIRTSSDTSESILPVFIWVEDKGTGILGDILNYTENPYNALHLYVPEEFGEKSCDKFTEIISDKEGFKLYVSNQKIPMIKKKSPQLRCSFIMPNETIVPVEKAFFFSAEMNYTYDITGEKSIEVKPTLGV